MLPQIDLHGILAFELDSLLVRAHLRMIRKEPPSYLAQTVHKRLVYGAARFMAPRGKQSRDTAQDRWWRHDNHVCFILLWFDWSHHETSLTCFKRTNVTIHCGCTRAEYMTLIVMGVFFFFFVTPLGYNHVIPRRIVNGATKSTCCVFFFFISCLGLTAANVRHFQ